jgi:hypothetical protein
MNQSETINEIAGALAKAQGEIKGAAKDSTNPHFKSKYADLSSVWDACRAALSKHGLSVIQTPDTTADGVFLYTTLAHSSGQWIRGVMPVRPVQDTPQGLGSAMTYARRYSLASMVGVAPDDDDDGQAASTGERTPANNGHRTAAPKQAEDPAVAKSREDFSRIMEALNLAKLPADIDKIIAAQGKTLAEIKAVSQTGYEKLMAHAEDRKANMLQQAA